jgi:MinD-like ATPase involved in chromosome partitioning or flagellar assembly
VLREGYDVGLLNDGFTDLIRDLNLDVLFIDTHPGMNEETLLSISISDALVIILRPDTQDYQGTAVTVDVARKLEVPTMLLMVNKVPSVYNTADVMKRVESAYNCEVAAALPHSDELMALASSGVFVLKYQDNPLTLGLEALATRLLQ